MIKIFRTISFMILCVAGSAVAQDVHFTQYYGTPLIVNPALTGVFDGTFRASNNYRSQWTGLGGGYKTIHLSADLPVGKGDLGPGFFGLGFMMYQDRAGAAGFTSSIFEGSISYVTALDPEKDNYLSIGFQGGLNQSSLDLTKGTWDSQWNGDAFDPSLPSKEVIQLQQFSYLDMNAGLLYYYVPDGYNSFSFGASMAHIGSPNVTYYKDASTPLRRRITLHSSGEIALDKENSMWITPKALFMMQGNQKEIMFGGYFKNKVQFRSHYTNYKKEAYFYLGAFYRMQDAFAVSARVEYNMFGLGLSYDFNTGYLGSLSTANAFEINLSYISYVKRGHRLKNYSKTPRFF